ncbi:uncharacterized protein LOC115880560 [Sitophilus oryzae]|uniref:Uncharacterized protein LOC115880560 n=1 Tax=Sitophilus oryzae TaxID=7048 RepID=A0A6J2XRG9_SITOR|nr:uncharacterized protein LOC115880560 [Sitophilus oryzae]
MLNHLRFADDVVVLASSLEELQTMLEQLHHTSAQVGLKMNLSKTKILNENEEQVNVNGQRIENVKELRVSQRAMERAIMGISLRDHIRNADIGRQTRITDIVERIANSKWSWAGHMARQSKERWAKRLLCWRPCLEKRPVGRPPKRWTDDIQTVAARPVIEDYKCKKRVPIQTVIKNSRYKNSVNIDEDRIFNHKSLQSKQNSQEVEEHVNKF